MIHPSILTLELPNPFSEGRNCVYVIRSEPLTMIDTGVATSPSFQALVEGLEENNLSIRDIGRVILTHKHIDHIGNAWRIQEASGAEILIHESETEALVEVDPCGQQFREVVNRRLAEWQVPMQYHSSVEMSYVPNWEIEPAKATGVVDGQRIELDCGALIVHHVPGHTGGSIMLQFGRYLLSGDHVLPDISPNIGGGDMEYRGLLQLYLQSLQRTIELASEIDEVLPGHGDPFRQLAQRCQTLADHHRQRLDQTTKFLCSHGPQHVYQVAEHLFGKLREFHVVLGCAEAQAHLEVLVDNGSVVCEQGRFLSA